ncbi:hypothetical protein [Vibrio sp. SCSIO 43137]|uniref:hypothetical protein n=1 Tax=Vibrio sp. SCSIO 43137 TaxID=3021011 RepID=UPI0023076775|nr:hypothetical protein [Vibrio sp. SCSIO 43137]WCE30742.1 hypothetical protein PK654_05555 [Vibrio sp. SCSIO 43137]
MHPAIYMLEKEFIEHKIVTRVPLFVLACMVLVFFALFMRGALPGDVSYQFHISGHISDASPMSLNQALASMAGIVSLVLSSLYLPKTLRKERMEGSSMFWRSMPVGLATSHIVKLIFGLLVIPLICSVIVIVGNMMLWFLTNGTNAQLAVLLSQTSVTGIFINWFSYLARMALAAIGLLPLACVALMVSQLVTAPILVMLLGTYAIKWLSVYLFGLYGVGEFFNAIFAIPVMVFTSNPFSGFMQAGVLNLVVYLLIGAASLAVSLKLSKTNEVSLRGLFSR